MFIFGKAYDRVGTSTINAEISAELWNKAEVLRNGKNKWDERDEFIDGEGEDHYDTFRAMFSDAEFTDTYVIADECYFGYGETLEEAKLNFCNIEE